MVHPRSNYNVVHLDINAEGNSDLILLAEAEFDKQHGNNIEFRKKNL